MHKIGYVIKLLLLFLLFVCIVFIHYNFMHFLISNIKMKPTGRDTVVIFGDATYQILKGTNLKREREYRLYKYHNGCILDYVYKYYDDKKNNKTYFIGKERLDSSFLFVIIDYSLINEKIYLCEELTDEYYMDFFSENEEFINLNSYYNNYSIEC